MYSADQLSCVAYRVRVETTVATDLQGRRRLEEVQREGRLVVRATPVAEGMAIEAWWDSLTLARRSDDGILTPSADGVIGGLYRGVLHPDGRFERTAAPWVPDEVAEVSDLSVALDDLFPVMSAGTARRIGDAGGMRRYRITSERALDAPADSARPFAVLESETSDGVAGWDRHGLRSWVRTIRSETRVKETPRRTFRTQVTQQVTVQRIEWCGGGAAGVRVQ